MLHVIPSLSSVHGSPGRAMASMRQALTKPGEEVETATTDDEDHGRRNGRRCAATQHENALTPCPMAV